MAAMRPWIGPAGVLAAALAAAAGCARGPQAPDTEGLVLVTLDTFRADHLGCAGNPTVRTPHLDRLERRGVQWDDAVTAIPLTTPSHATLLTGRLPRSHGLVKNRMRLDASVVTLAQRLAQAGWRTGAVVSSAVVLGPEFGLDRAGDDGAGAPSGLG
ncbi:sulfatase-like hydrolase/transferase, partial [bacterium]|nr:sulfatase-like hydrolase/transferase [bacterium]